MNFLLAILLGTGVVLGALGMILLIAGGVAASMMDAGSGTDGVVDTTGRPVPTRPAVPVAPRPSTPLAA